jgi:hypothetical protein
MLMAQHPSPSSKKVALDATPSIKFKNNDLGAYEVEMEACKQDDGDDDNQAQIASRAALKGMELREKLQFCNEQIHQWHQLQTNLMTRADDTNPPSSSQSSSCVDKSAADVKVVVAWSGADTLSNKFSGAVKFMSSKLSAEKVHAHVHADADADADPRPSLVQGDNDAEAPHTAEVAGWASKGAWRP